jgi:hypothetical protein
MHILRNHRPFMQELICLGIRCKTGEVAEASPYFTRVMFTIKVSGHTVMLSLQSAEIYHCQSNEYWANCSYANGLKHPPEPRQIDLHDKNVTLACGLHQEPLLTDDGDETVVELTLMRNHNTSNATLFRCRCTPPSQAQTNLEILREIPILSNSTKVVTWCWTRTPWNQPRSRDLHSPLRPRRNAVKPQHLQQSRILPPRARIELGNLWETQTLVENRPNIRRH